MTEAFAAWIAAGGDDGDTVRDGVGRHSRSSHRVPSAGTLPFPDEALIARLRAGDERSFETLYTTHARPLAAYVLSVTRAPGDVQDVVHDTYLALWRRRASLAPSDHVVGFLYRTARNLALSRARHTTVIRRVEDEMSTAPPGMSERAVAPDIRLDLEERHRVLATALRALPERQRLAIQLRFYEDMPYVEIGRVLGVSEKGAFMLVSRAIAALRPLTALFSLPERAP